MGSTKRPSGMRRSELERGRRRERRGARRSTLRPRGRGAAVRPVARRPGPRRGGRPRTRRASSAPARRRRRRLATISSTDTTTVRAARATSRSTSARWSGGHGNWTLPSASARHAWTKATSGRMRGNGEQFIAGVGIDDRPEAALLDELRAEGGAGGEEGQPHHRCPQPADEHPLGELPVLDRRRRRRPPRSRGRGRAGRARRSSRRRCEARPRRGGARPRGSP